MPYTYFSDTNQYEFTRNLIKGRIAESIFQQMFAETNYYTIIPLGYENIVPELAQYRSKVKYKNALKNIDNIPDFLMISENKESVYFIEVKFRHHLIQNDICEIAKKINARWKPSWLFIATPEGFFFDSCTNIVKKAEIQPLEGVKVTKYIQDRYLRILTEFINKESIEAIY